MNEEKYNIEDLEKVFLEHHEKALEQHKKQQEAHKANYGEEYPHEFFSISLALHVICKEINKINHAIDILEKCIITPEKWGNLRD